VIGWYLLQAALHLRVFTFSFVKNAVKQVGVVCHTRKCYKFWKSIFVSETKHVREVTETDHCTRYKNAKTDINLCK
jgi:uncharacterized Fe-S cluster-containing MiaB family protein